MTDLSRQSGRSDANLSMSFAVEGRRGYCGGRRRCRRGGPGRKTV